jgi:nucleotide-binding universal stress UspA family protein
MLQKIFVPLDGSDLAERALTYATALATQTDAQLMLLRAAQSHTLIGVGARERQASAVRADELYLDEVATWVRKGGFVCETVVVHGHAAECIVNQARAARADLIVRFQCWCSGRGGPCSAGRSGATSRSCSRQSMDRHSPRSLWK